MPLDFVCPNCQARTLVPDEFLGQSGPCFSCGKTVTVPINAAVVATAAGARPVDAAKVRARLARRRNLFNVVGLVCAGVFSLGLTVALVLLIAIPAIRAARNARSSANCSTQLSRIAAAIRQYQAVYGVYPPAYIAGADGKPMHSWRVLILPQLGESSLYSRYQFEEPWDSQNNMMVARQMPAVYACDTDTLARDQHETSYLVPVGGKTMFPKGKSRTLPEIKDGTNNTLLVVESHGTGVLWTEPTDLPVSNLRFGSSKKSGGGPTLSSGHEDGVHIVTVDGEVFLVPTDTPAEVMTALSTVAGQEVIPWELLGK